MPTTARKHFDEDMRRAEALRLLAEREAPVSAERGADLARSSVVFAVGALDAYLCDAFVDVLSLTMTSCRKQKQALPSGYAKVLLPAGPLFAAQYTKRHNWALRMAARKLMERDNLLQLSRLESLFNPALAKGHKLWLEMIGSYIALKRPRLTSYVPADLASLTGPALDKAKGKAKAALFQRVGSIIQRRHDIAHNCDRPKVAYQVMTPAIAKKMLDDVRSFVTVLDRHLDTHRPH